MKINRLRNTIFVVAQLFLGVSFGALLSDIYNNDFVWLIALIAYFVLGIVAIILDTSMDCPPMSNLLCPKFGPIAVILTSLPASSAAFFNK